jgi:hypothetical protein
MRRTICLVGTRWTNESASSRDCRRREHRHVSRERAVELVRTAQAEWLIPGTVIRAKAAAGKPNRLSIKVGETLAMMVYRGSQVGRQMVREIRRKH